MNKLKFWNTEYPFKDFLLISSKREISEDIINRLSINLQEINLNIFKLNKYEKVSNYIISNNNDVNNNMVFSGMGIYKNKFYFGQNDLDDNIDEDFINSTGMFTAIRINNEEMLIGQDFFGCGSLFYAQYNDAIYISNRYHLLLLVLAWSGFKGELDKAKILYSTYFYYSYIFNTNGHSNMDIKNVYTLPINKYILINKNGWEFKVKEETNNAFKGITNKSYEEVFELGVNELFENVETILKCDDFNKKVVDISGGFDSRLTLGLVDKLNNNKTNIQANTQNSVVQKDLEIGDALRKLLNIPLYKEEVNDIYPITLDESTTIWRSYFMGTYYRTGLGSWSNRNQNNKCIRLTGALGEYYRAKYLATSYGKLLEGNNNLPIYTFSKNLVNHDNRFLLNPKDLSLVYNLFENTMKYDIVGDSTESKLENYYEFFFGRYHFGMNAYSTYHDMPSYNVLMSKNLLTSSRMIDSKERINEKFMLSLTERVNPVLAWMPYANKNIDTRGMLNSMKLYHNDFKNYDVKLDYDIKEWELQKLENDDYRRTLQKNKSYDLDKIFYEQWRDINSYIKSETIKNYKKLCEYIDIYNEEFMNYILNIEETDSRFKVIYGKITSILDQISIFK